MKNSRLLLLLGLFTHFVTESSAQCDYFCQAEQRWSLQELYHRLEGPLWLDSSKWDTAESPQDNYTAAWPAHCSWFGVACCSPKHIVAVVSRISTPIFMSCTTVGAVAGVRLLGNNLQGTLPEDEELWGSLSTLVYLSLSGNRIVGSLPDALVNLPGLRVLQLDNNVLVATLPAALMRSKTLRQLSLEHNQLYGTIPSWGRNSTLKQLNLGHNQLTGSIPADWASNNIMQVLNLEWNKLTGNLVDPLQTGQMNTTPIENSLQLLLQHNQLGGSVPFSLSSFAITRLDLSNNQFVGHLTFVAAMSQILSLRLANNKFDGPIIGPVLPNPAIQEYDVHGNRLTGTLPQILLESLVKLDLRNNLLTGPISDSYLPALELALATGNNLRHGYPSNLNQQGEPLPGFCSFDMSVSVRVSDVEYLLCPGILTNHTTFPELNILMIDSFYYHYVHCDCMDGYKKQWNGNRLKCIPYKQYNWTLIGLGTSLGGLFVLSLTIGGIAYWWHRRLISQHPLQKSKGPPGSGQPLTLVATDVEGSTELWEWNRAAMMDAQTIHDRLIRANLSKCFGYEVATEGDAFVLAFHEPRDAVAWAIMTQQALLTAAWPEQMEQHPRTCIRLQLGQEEDNHSIGEGGATKWKLSEVDVKRIISMGLGVRMAISSGKADAVVTNENSQMREYQGAVNDRVVAMLGVINGGQIMMDCNTFHGINTRLPDMAKAVPDSPNYDLLMARQKKPIHLKRAFSSFSAVSRLDSRVFKRAASRLFDSRPTVSRNTSLATRESSLTSPQSPGDQQASKEKAAVKAVLQATGPALQRRLSTRLVPRPAEEDLAQLMIINMGTHLLKNVEGPQLLVQVGIPGLEDRARALPPLKSIALSPGYFHAPAALLSPLPCGQQILVTPAPLSSMCMLFCSLEGLDAMREANAEAAQNVLLIYRSMVHLWLNVLSGYECQEANGDFMLAFQTTTQAAQFCLQVQAEMLNALYGDDVLCLPCCGPVMDDDLQYLWRGPRIRMGLCEGVPQHVIPHSTSGRADYFGSLVNRAARFCHCAAHGGQIMLPLALAEALLEEWSGTKASLSGSAAAATLFSKHVLQATGSFQRAASGASSEAATLRSSLEKAQLRLPPLNIAPIDSTADYFADMPETPTTPLGRFNSAPATTATAIRKLGESLSKKASALANPLSALTNPLFAWAGPTAGEPSPTGSSELVPLREESFSPQSSLGQPFSRVGFSSRMQRDSMRRMGPEAELGPNPFFEHDLSQPPARQLQGSLRNSIKGINVPPSAALPPTDADSAAAEPQARGSSAVTFDESAGASQPSAETAEVAAHGRSRRGSYAALQSPLAPQRSGGIPRQTSLANSEWEGSGQVRRMSVAWKPIQNVEFHHRGVFAFKGVPELQPMIQLTSSHLAARHFPNQPPSKKGKLVSPAQGLQCTLFLT